MIEEITGFFETVLQASESKVFQEAANQQITTNRYERDPAARAACLRIHGLHAKDVASISKKIYGSKFGTQFIHVHHLTPVAKGEVKTNAKRDLIPVCPNCHAMLHRGASPPRPDELRQIMELQRKSIDRKSSVLQLAD